MLFCGSQPSFAQRTQKLPSAEKVVDKYLKASGGKKRVAAIREVVLDWSIQLKDQSIGVARHYYKAPTSWRSEMTFANGQIVGAANSSSAWSLGLDGVLRTLTGAEAGAAKLQAVLEAGHLIDFKKKNVAARVLSLGDIGSEPAFIVEFTTRSGGKLVYYFSRESGLVTKITDDSRNTTTRLSDYRTVDGVMLPHRMSIELPGSGELTLILQKAQFNTAVDSKIFDPPPAAETLDVAALLREVERNQDQLDNRFTEYSFVQTETDKEISNKGEIKKKTSKTYEVYPLRNRPPVQKLIAENGAPLNAERAAKEEKRVQEEFEKAERERDKDEQRVQKRRAERMRRRAAGKDQDDDDVEISQFLKICEFVSPRRERFRDRDVVVFDFRPRPGFKPRNRQEDLISKLVGVVWIDPQDRQVIRLEARLAEGFKMAGGLLFLLRPGAAFVMEQTRMAEGMWLPRLAQINLSMKVLLFGGSDLNKTIEWSNYRHFSGDVTDYKLDAPKVADEKKP